MKYLLLCILLVGASSLEARKPKKSYGTPQKKKLDSKLKRALRILKESRGCEEEFDAARVAYHLNSDEATRVLVTPEEASCFLGKDDKKQ